MPSHMASAVGLIIGMVGVIILFIWDRHNQIFPEYIEELLRTPRRCRMRTAKNHIDDTRRRKHRHAVLCGSDSSSYLSGSVSIVERW